MLGVEHTGGDPSLAVGVVMKDFFQGLLMAVLIFAFGIGFAAAVKKISDIDAKPVDSWQSFKDLSGRVNNQGKLIEQLQGMVSQLQREGRK